jgi:UDP-N-acetylmuramoyl-L-alanyl-D-glutamate--2,6-diaminopimelate ligase
MGEIANRLADVVVVTDDNPRYEKAEDIRAEILSEVPHAIEIADREKAIAYGIENLNEGDVLVVAGKGHEEGQVIGEEVLPFSDVEIIEKILKEL